MPNYFLYARKSTDVEDKQVLSIDAQLSELRSLAKHEGLQIVVEFVEKQSAKMPGRPVFNDMIRRIIAGEAQGIVCWKIDRLARNPMDGGQISWLLQQSVIQHIQTHDRSFLPADNVLMMSVELGMANQYIRDLSANTKRGQREKARRGEYPGLAPLGYINNPRTKRVEVDRRKAPAVRAAFELYAENESRLEDIAKFLLSRGVKTKGGKPLSKDRVSYMLGNPFYYGHFRYAGEMYEGRHTGIIPKKLFDRVQVVLADRSRPHKRPVNEPQPLCGLFRCGECGASITAENRTKTQKNGNIHHYIYYRCTKKIRPCSQPHIRDGELVEQLSATLSEYALPSTWAEELSRMADKDEAEAANATETEQQTTREEIQAIKAKLDRLLSAYLEQDIEQEIYRREKAELLSRKKVLREKIANLERGAIAWLEPLRTWIKDSENAGETAVSQDLFAKKSCALKLSGSNPLLQNKKIVFVPSQPSYALRASRINFSKSASSSNLVAFYNELRTYFIKNP